MDSYCKTDVPGECLHPRSVLLYGFFFFFKYNIYLIQNYDFASEKPIQYYAVVSISKCKI